MEGPGRLNGGWDDDVRGGRLLLGDEMQDGVTARSS